MRKQLLDAVTDAFGSGWAWSAGPVALAVLSGLHWLRTATWPTWRLHDWVTFRPESHWPGTQRVIEWFLGLPLLFSLSLLYWCFHLGLFVLWILLVIGFDLYGDRRESQNGANGT